MYGYVRNAGLNDKKKRDGNNMGGHAVGAFIFVMIFAGLGIKTWSGIKRRVADCCCVKPDTGLSDIDF